VAGEQQNELLRGTLDMLILQTLTARPLHGYGIAQQIARLSQSVLSVARTTTCSASWIPARRAAAVPATIAMKTG